MTENQIKRMSELRNYLREVKDIEREDFDKWFKGKQEVCVNIGAWLILIEEDQ